MTRPNTPSPQPSEQHASELRFQLMVESVVDYAIFLLDPAGHVQTWNLGAKRVKGYEADEIIGRHFSCFYTPEDQQRGHPAEVLSRAIEAGHHAEEGWRVRKDGTRFWASLVLTTMRAPDGHIVGFAKVTRDLTERRAAEEELRQARDFLDRRVAERTAELARRDAEKDEFLAMLAHELRNPLAPIVNATEVLDARAGDEDVVRRQQAIIRRQAMHMGRLLDDLLDVSRISGGKIALRREVLDLWECVEQTAEGCRALIQSREQHVTLSGPREPVMVQADPTRLNQVIGNLLNNAAKYTDIGGEISVSLEVEGAFAVLRVRDNGVGIDAAFLPRIFDLFVQGDRSLERAEGGLGIGLTMVKRLVELHGGRVAAASGGRGQGSEFTVRWPLAVARQPAPEVEEVGRRAVGTKRSVLVVDDNRDAADSLVELIRLWGHAAMAAYDGPGALQAAAETQAEVILLDISMPGMDGFEVARSLRDGVVAHNTVVVALTGYGQRDDRRRALEAGFDEHFTKPVDPAALKALLESTGAQEPA